MKVVRISRNEFDIKGAEILADKIKEINGKVVLAIPGGRSVAGIFRELLKRDIDWEKIHLFMVDERMVPLEHEDSNFKLAKESFIDNLAGKLPEENLHPFRVEEGISAYEEELKSLGGKYDIVLLSSGEDGHIGALYPDHDSIKDDSPYYISMDDSPKPPPKRMSMSKKLLLRSGFALILFLGFGKQDALKMFLDESLTFMDCPAKLVQELDYIALTDFEAKDA